MITIVFQLSYMHGERTKPPIVNCHTHIFTGDHVPPWLAKTVVPKPFCYLLPLNLFVWIFRWWYNYPARIPYTPIYKKWQEFYAALQTAFNRFGIFRTILEYYVTAQAFFFLYARLKPVFPPDQTWVSGWLDQASVWLTQKGLLWVLPGWCQWAILVFVIIFFPSAKNLFFFLFRQLWGVLRKLPGKQTTEVFKRYLNIGRYAFHKKQSATLQQLKAQYPTGTGLVVLPMDMEYMAAGKPALRYRDQMRKLSFLKDKPVNHDRLLPFVFVDPRRMVPLKEEKRYRKGDRIFFDYRVVDGKVVLNDCFIRYLIEEKKFSGFKIYPALGYYPFDHRLLPLWKYAADHQLPILTHCVQGPMYYRGKKKQEWNHHPIFEQAIGKKDEETDLEEKEDNNKKVSKYGPLVLPQLKNDAFSSNFTHPMNFLCLLEDELLAKVVDLAFKKTGDVRLKEIFGLTESAPGKAALISSGLHDLKICLAHYGGADQWKRYFEKDRYGHSNQFTKNPHRGIEFLRTTNNQPSPGKPEQIWKYTDWYSIISSLMLQHPNVYADISYILHNDAEVLPLLKQTLQNPWLRNKVLYGTDFYVVRNHKSDKNMLADMMGGLQEEDFDQIARENPRRFLNLLQA